MDISNLIKSIICTYELEPRIENKISRIAINRVQELREDGYCRRFDDIYRYIGELIDKFEVPYNERFLLRLDKPISHDSEKTLLDLIGIEDQTLTGYIKNSEPFGGVYLDEIINVLDNHIDKDNLDFIKQLTSSEQSLRDILLNFEEIIKDAPRILSRIKELSRVYRKGEKIIIPKRPIVKIKFDPLYIEWFTCWVQ